MVDMSARLCQIMGLPIREWVEPGEITGGSGKAVSETEDLRTHSQSPCETKRGGGGYVDYVGIVYLWEDFMIGVLQ